jgi:Membrane bound O-acyl transferase family
MFDNFLLHLPTTDNRLPLYIFDYGEKRYGLFMLSPQIWAAMFGMALISVAAAVPMAVLLYYGVVQQPRKYWFFRYLIGYGIMAFWLFAPGACIDQAGIENSIVRFCVVTIMPIIALFRTLEAMYSDGLSNMGAEDFVSYYCLPLRSLVVNGKTLPSSLWNTCSYLGTTASLILFLGCYQSLLLATNIIPIYGKGPDSTPNRLYDWHSLWEIDFLKHTLVIAPLFQCYLSCFANGMIFLVALITGNVPEPFSDKPLLCSTSPGDFWGRRWNLIIHRALKDGIFRPVIRFTGSKMMGVIAAFTASGLFHEHVLRVVFHRFPATHGTTLVFFWWHAALLLVENLVGWPPARLPWPLSTVVTVLVGSLPGHWFLDTYWRSDFFVVGQLALPMIKEMAT